MTERQKPDLSSIEPLGPAPDADDADAAEQDAGRVGRAVVGAATSPLAVGVEADADARARKDDAGEPPDAVTSPETEEQLDRLRRG
jgi:hypothetical protein